MSTFAAWLILLVIVLLVVGFINGVEAIERYIGNKKYKKYKEDQKRRLGL